MNLCCKLSDCPQDSVEIGAAILSYFCIDATIAYRDGFCVKFVSMSAVFF